MSTLRLAGLGGGYGRMRVLHDIDATLEQGAALVLLGRNGAGKTTLLRTVAGLQPARGGSTLLDGVALPQRRPWQVARRGVTMVLEGGRVLGGHSIADNIALGEERCRDRVLGRQLMDICRDAFPLLGQRSEEAAASLSGGERMQLAVTQALAAAPLFLLLDEPSVGLSPAMTRTVFALLDRVRRIEGGPGLLIAEQLVGDELDMAERALVLDNGRVVAEGVPRELRRDGSILAAYLGLPAPAPIPPA